MALHHAKQRQIQGQQFPDTLVDATNGQPLHVPGVPGSAHNGVSGVGGIFGVGGLLGPDEPIAMRESEALTLGPSCTCAKCVPSDCHVHESNVQLKEAQNAKLRARLEGLEGCIPGYDWDDAAGPSSGSAKPVRGSSA